MANGFRSYADATDGAARPFPSQGCIDVWRLSVAEWTSRLPACRALLSADETSQIDRLVFPRDRAVRAIARASLRCILARDLACHPTQVVLVKTPHGKPVLARQSGALEFSTSHSGDVVLHAVTRGRRVGVDVEAIGPAPADPALARAIFSDLEADHLESLPQQERSGAFHGIWTRKEAYLKALGVGLSHPLQGFSVVGAGLPRRRIVDGGTGRPVAGWQLHPLAAGEGYAACLAYAGPPAAVVVRPYPPHVLDGYPSPPPAGLPASGQG